jgi:hypothetical protein
MDILLSNGEDRPVIASLDKRQWRDILWDEPVPRQMKSFEGALIRRADVAFAA